MLWTSTKAGGWGDREMRQQLKVEEGESLAVESFYKLLSNSQERRTLASGRG